MRFRLFHVECAQQFISIDRLLDWLMV